MIILKIVGSVAKTYAVVAAILVHTAMWSMAERLGVFQRQGRRAHPDTW